MDKLIDYLKHRVWDKLSYNCQENLTMLFYVVCGLILIPVFLLLLFIGGILVGQYPFIALLIPLWGPGFLCWMLILAPFWGLYRLIRWGLKRTAPA